VNARVYLNTTTLAASSSIDGGGFTVPPLRAYSDVIFRFRLARELEGQSVPDDRTIDSVVSRIGYQDAAPTSGSATWDITVGGDTKTTAAIPYNATAAQVKAALDAALTSPLAALAPVTVDLVDEGWRIVFAGVDETVTISAATNKLWPVSFVNADRVEFDGGWASLVAYRQTPVAESATAEETVAPVPTVTQEQIGATVDGYAINEVQRIILSPGYAGGTWRLVWDGVKSPILSGFPTVEEIQAALDEIAPAGGIFTLIPVEDGVLVEFAGVMSGEPQELMTTEEFTPPPTEYVVVLDTGTAAMRTLMAGAGTDGEVEVPADITVTVEDDSAPGGMATHSFPFLLTFTRPVSDDGRNVSAYLDWTQPLSRVNNLAFSPDSLLVGNRAVRKVIGDGVATSFVIPHNLGALTGTFTADASTDVCSRAAHGFFNGDPVTVSSSGTLPGNLTAGVTYYIVSAATNTFKLAATPGGSAIDINSAGSGTHTVTMADGTTDVVFVEVWEAAGLKRRVSPTAYTVAITTDDSVTVSGFASTPTTGQYLVVVQTAGRPATYQAHSHAIAEVTGLQAALDALSARITALEAGNFGGSAPAGSTATGKLDRALPRVWSIPRARTLPEDPGGLLDWNAFYDGSPLRDLRLLPAVHMEIGNLETLPSTLPAPAASYRDRVFYSSTERTDFPNGTLPAGAFAACDGRDWYRVARESTDESTWYPTLFDLELFRLSISPDELALRTTLNLAFGFEAACLAPSRRPGERRTVARWSLLLERGVRLEDDALTTEGSNIDTHFSSPVVLARHDFDLTAVPTTKRFGLSVSRSGAGVLTATATKFFTDLPVSAPDSADFVLRARLARFDVEDLPLDGRGVIAVRGLDVGSDGNAETTLGRYSIS
jgi:hypothetical protein